MNRNGGVTISCKKKNHHLFRPTVLVASLSNVHFIRSLTVGGQAPLGNHSLKFLLMDVKMLQSMFKVWYTFL